jgi:hypothetical protein
MLFSLPYCHRVTIYLGLTLSLMEGFRVSHLTAGLLGFGLIKHTSNDVFTGTRTEKKNSQDNSPALSYLFKKFTPNVFLSNLPSKEGRSNATYPVRVRVNRGQGDKSSYIFWIPFL